MRPLYRSCSAYAHVQPIDSAELPFGAGKITRDRALFVRARF